MAKRILYAVHEKDEAAARAVLCLRLALGELLELSAEDRAIDQHVDQVKVAGDEPPCAPFDSVPIFTCGSITYPSRFFRVITPMNREKLMGNIPLWAQSTEFQIAFNPKADLGRREKRRKVLCISLACQDLHGRVGGYTHPAKKRPPYRFGRKARIAQQCSAEQ